MMKISEPAFRVQTFRVLASRDQLQAEHFLVLVVCKDQVSLLLWQNVKQCFTWRCRTTANWHTSAGLKWLASWHSSQTLNLKPSACSWHCCLSFACCCFDGSSGFRPAFPPENPLEPETVGLVGLLGSGAYPTFSIWPKSASRNGQVSAERGRDGRRCAHCTGPCGL